MTSFKVDEIDFGKEYLLSIRAVSIDNSGKEIVGDFTATHLISTGTLINSL